MAHDHLAHAVFTFMQIITILILFKYLVLSQITLNALKHNFNHYYVNNWVKFKLSHVHTEQLLYDIIQVSNDQMKMAGKSINSIQQIYF